MTQSPALARITPIPSPGSSEVSRAISLAELHSEIVDPLTGSSWDSAALSHPDATVFHSSAWARVLGKTYGHKPFYLRFSQDEETVGLVPLMEVTSLVTGKRAISMPFSDFCAPLPFDHPQVSSMFNVIVELARERCWRYVEFRGGETILPEWASVAATYYGHTLDLTLGAETLFYRVDSSVRRAVRKATKSGLSVDVSNSRIGMRQYYKLHTRTRRRHGLPPQTLSFFLNIYDEIIKPGLGFIVIARKSKTPVAAAIFFHSENNAVYKFGASEDKLRQLRGNNLVMWEAISMLAQKGVKTLHFGRTAETNAGLRRFKLSWGTKEQVIKYFRCSSDGRSSGERQAKEVGFYNKIFRWLPIPAGRGIGRMLYPHLD